MKLASESADGTNSKVPMSEGMFQKEQLIRTLTDHSLQLVIDTPLAVINNILLHQCVV
jgi:hypothetical protein